ncbi:hypothetical protein GY45DRAFT_172684 [Cubamyces sp. BRFM 1775]|nr:hypothetical protein GY45DRAFT_172684 [Cubamyces sp. BRFM 1775]
MASRPVLRQALLAAVTRPDGISPNSIDISRHGCRPDSFQELFAAVAMVREVRLCRVRGVLRFFPISSMPMQYQNQTRDPTSEQWKEDRGDPLPERWPKHVYRAQHVEYPRSDRTHSSWRACSTSMHMMIPARAL